MKKFKIYQIKNIGDCKYAYMGYDYAESKLNLDDYEEVVNSEIAGSDDTELLNYIWRIGNDGTLQKDYYMHSVSVSDIIEIEGKKYYVDSFGFKELQ